MVVIQVKFVHLEPRTKTSTEKPHVCHRQRCHSKSRSYWYMKPRD